MLKVMEDGELKVKVEAEKVSAMQKEINEKDSRIG